MKAEAMKCLVEMEEAGEFDRICAFADTTVRTRKTNRHSLTWSSFSVSMV
jgi:hypothetical protein